VPAHTLRAMVALAPDPELLGQVESEGYAVVRQLVPLDAREAALRRVHVDVMRSGLSTAEIAGYQDVKVWFPHLRWEPEIVALADYLPPAAREGELCDPQILLHLPDEATDWQLEPHLDAAPPWGNGRVYRLIAGVALTPGGRRNGGLVVWPFRGQGPVPVDLDAGDVVLMHPRLPHSGTLNRGGAIRYAVYLRYLER
jgi:hypothetical protein